MKLLFSCDNHRDLLPHFFKHYKSLGIDEFICLAVDSTIEHPDISMVFHCSSSPDIPDSAIIRDHWNNIIVPKVISPKEWWAIADIDEMHQYPLPLPELIRKCNKTRRNCVLGYFLDRIAPGGLPPVRPTPSLENQFPIQLHVTKHLGANTQKAMVIRGIKPLSSGNHFLMTKKQRPYEELGVVHHYKWNQNAVERVKQRAEQLRRLDLFWASESETFLKHYDGTMRYWMRKYYMI